MNRETFISALAAKAGLSPYSASRALDAFAEILANEMTGGGKLQLRRLGTFHHVKRPERWGVNPQDGSRIRIAEKHTVRFTPGSALLARISKSNTSQGNA